MRNHTSIDNTYLQVNEEAVLPRRGVPKFVLVPVSPLFFAVGMQVCVAKMIIIVDCGVPFGRLMMVGLECAAITCG